MGDFYSLGQHGQMLQRTDVLYVDESSTSKQRHLWACLRRRSMKQGLADLSDDLTQVNHT